MPRRKKEVIKVKYILPEHAYTEVNERILSNSTYKRKEVWLQKFYYLLEYISLQNFDNNLDHSKDYVNVNSEVMSNQLRISNGRMAAMLRDLRHWQILKKDGIMKRAVKSKRGKMTIYLEDGKSYGYQFINMSDLMEVEIRDSNHLYRRNIEAMKRNMDSDENLNRYQQVISMISINMDGVDETIQEVIQAKQLSITLQERYRKFIEDADSKYRIISETNMEYAVLPFAGTIVPESTAHKSQKSNVGSKSICSKCIFEVKRFKRKKIKRVKKFESESSTIARLRRSIFNINNGYAVAHRPVEHSRVYCEITNLKRELRKHIRLDGRMVAGIDIRNSQPLIACIIIKRYWLERQGYLPEDVIRYQTACESGRFYDDFMHALNLPTELRSEFKGDFFGKVFFSMVTEKSNLLKTMFLERYPSVWQMICDEKGGLYSRSYAEFANKLQKVEATIIFDNVNVPLLQRGIKAFNIFDSIYVNSRTGYHTALKLMMETFNELGLNPSFNIDGIENLPD